MNYINDKKKINKQKISTNSGIKVPIVEQSCIGCGACVVICPKVFYLNDEGISTVKKLDNYQNLSIENCVLACPVGAIKFQ